MILKILIKEEEMKNFNIIKVIAIFSFLILLSGGGVNKEDAEVRGMKIDEMLNIIIKFESMLNKKVPLQSDFDYFYYGDHESERRMYIAYELCEQLKLEPDTEPCAEAINRILEGYGWKKGDKNYPSLYLLQIKNIVTDNKDMPIKIFVDPRIGPCYKKEDIESSAQLVDAVAVIGNNKFKKLSLAFPCDMETQKYWKIDLRMIDGKYVEDYPLTIKPPPEQK